METGPFSVEARTVQHDPFICSTWLLLVASVQALRQSAALQLIGAWPDVSTRNPERNVSGTESASGPLMVWASSWLPFHVSLARLTAIGPFWAVRCTSPP